MEEAINWKRGDPASTHGCATISKGNPVILSQVKATNDHGKLSSLGCLISLYKHKQLAFYSSGIHLLFSFTLMSRRIFIE